MRILIVNQKEVAELISVTELMPVMEDALKTLARGEAILPQRPSIWLPDQSGQLVMMPTYLPNIKAFGLKVITYFPGNMNSPYDTHQGGVMLFDTTNGNLLAMIDATEITANRTAAATGVASKALARDDSSKLALIGSGTQARTHLEAMLHAHDIKEVKVWALPLEHAQGFARRESERHNVEIEVPETAEEAVTGADIICTCTSAKQPVLFGKWLKPGMHINAVGSTVPHTRELDTEALVKCKMFVDRKEAALNEAGDFLFPQKEGAVTEDHIKGEIGDVLLGKNPGRESTEEITLFESLGLAIEDVAAAFHISNKAKEKDMGTWIEFGGDRHRPSE